VNLHSSEVKALILQVDLLTLYISRMNYNDSYRVSRAGG
jgi:hypothetical protein